MQEITLETLNKKSESIKLYLETALSSKLKIPVIVDDETCRVLAYSVITRGGDYTVCRNGKEENLKSIVLRLNLDSQPTDIND